MHDVIIVGGGLAGLALLNAIDKTKQSVVLFDAKTNVAQPSSRPLVLTANNANWLNYKAGFALTEVKVSLHRKPGILKLKAAEFGLDAFGYVVDVAQLYTKLLSQTKQYIKQANIKNVVEQTDFVELLLDDGTIVKTKQLIACDGANSLVSKCLQMPKITTGPLSVAVMPNVTLLQTAPAQLRFVPGGTVAFLPTGPTSGTIVATGAAVNYEMQSIWARHLQLAAEPKDKITYEQTCFYLEQIATKHVLFVGNAAHNLAPVGAQGFNLACSNIQDLLKDPSQYQAMVMPRIKTFYNNCDFLVRTDITRLPLFGSLGLALLNINQKLRAELVNMGMQNDGC